MVCAFTRNAHTQRHTHTHPAGAAFGDTWCAETTCYPPRATCCNILASNSHGFATGFALFGLRKRWQHAPGFAGRETHTPTPSPGISFPPVMSITRTKTPAQKPNAFSGHTTTVRWRGQWIGKLLVTGLCQLRLGLLREDISLGLHR